MLLIYTKKTTKRIKYIFKLILEEQLGLEHSFTTSEDDFMEYDGPKFNYSDKKLKDELFFAASELLFKTGIKGQEPGYFEHDGLTACFPVYYKESVLPFDPFASCFYIVTRYEEYLPHIEDMYGRFRATESDAFKQGFLHKPVVNIWSEKIGFLLKEKFPEIKIKDKRFKYIPTIDIDSAYAYRLKGFIRITGGYFKSLGNLDVEEIKQRTRVLLGKEKDPFDNYDYQFILQQKYGLDPLYFILLGDYNQYDKNIPPFNRKFRVLIKTLADHADVGIHPSYDSNLRPATLSKEIEHLSKILNRNVTKSRQHFLKLSLPTTYRNLISLDISEDFTMGYALETGFRAGIADSYMFFDLDLESETNLRIFPFAVMDGTLKDYKNLSPDAALDQIKTIIDEVKAVKGTFISLWHNESLSDQKRWKGWRKVYEGMIQYATS